MKSLLILSLMIVGSLSAHATQCRKECKAEYLDCITTVRADAVENKKGANYEVIEAVNAQVSSSLTVCYKIKKQCFRKCSNPESEPTSP